MRTLTLVLVALFVATPALAQKSAEAHPEEKLVYVPDSDKAMSAAMAQARRTLPDFFAHFAAPAAGEYSFAIKYDLLPEPGKAEYIWAEVISHSPGVTIARLANEPLDPRFSYGEKVSVTDGDIIDWGYVRGDVMQGNFTTRVLLDHMPPKEAEGLRAALGW